MDNEDDVRQKKRHQHVPGRVTGGRKRMAPTRLFLFSNEKKKEKKRREPSGADYDGLGGPI